MKTAGKSQPHKAPVLCNMFSELLEGTTLEVARRLIGCTLSYNAPEGVMAGIINETEAYTEEDPACHAYGGKQTRKNQTMFQESGHLYIYLIYGMYHCANLVTEEAGRGSAVLIRSVLPTEGVELMIQNRNYKEKNLKNLCNGPGKLCQAFNWNLSLDGLDLRKKNSKITLHPASSPPTKVIETPRIGITKGVELPWRFYSI